MTTRLTDAYVAGLIDGEGSVGINHHKNIYTARVDVGMTEKAIEILRLLADSYGGTVQQARPATDTWDAAFTWTVTGRLAQAFLRKIEPLLRLKGEQARIALKVEEIRDGLRQSADGRRSYWTDEARDRCSVLKRRIHELNRKGPPIPQGSQSRMIARLVAGVLVTNQGDLFGDLGWETFNGPWPKSGMWDGTGFYELPTSERPTAGQESSSSPNLPTPDAYPRGGSQHPDKRIAGGHAVSLQDVAEWVLCSQPRAQPEAAATPKR